MQGVNYQSIESSYNITNMSEFTPNPACGLTTNDTTYRDLVYAVDLNGDTPEPNVTIELNNATRTIAMTINDNTLTGPYYYRITVAIDWI